MANQQAVPSTKNEYALSPFPNLLASKEEKAQDSFGLAEAEAIWGSHKNNSLIFNEQRQRDVLNRQYAEGLQSIEKYKNMRGLTGPSYSNVDFSPVNIISATINRVLGTLTSTPYKIQCNAIDPESKVRFDDYRNEMYTDMILKPFSDLAKKRTGVPLVGDNKQVPEDDDEAELAIQMNYKEAASEAMEQAFEYILSNNKFEKSKRELIKDLLVIDRAAIYRYYDEDWNIKFERVDPVDVITPYSKYDDFRNIPYIGLLKSYTIGQIATMKNYTEEQLYNIAKNNAGINQNPAWNWGLSYEGYYRSNAIGIRPYYNFNIQVMEFYFLTVDKEIREAKTNKRRSYFNTLSETDFANKTQDGILPTGDNSEIITRNVQNVYEGKWIVGTKEMISYGLMKNIPREKINGSYSPKASLPIKMVAPGIYDMKNKSMVEKMIPSEDQINLANLTLQVFSAKAKPPGVQIDYSALLDAAAGMGAGIEPLDLIKLYEQTGNLITSSTNTDGDPINARAMTELRGGLSGAVMELVQIHQHYRGLMNDVAGISPNFDPSTSPKDVGLGVQDNAIQATSHALRPTFDAYKELLLEGAQDLSLMIQDCIENDNEAFINAIGTYATKALDYGKSLALVQIGIKIELLPDDVEKKDLIDLMSLGIEQGMLKPSDVIRIKQVMKENVKIAAQLLVYLEAKNAKQKQAESAQLQQQNADVQTQSAQAAEQGKAQTLMLAEKAKQSTIQMQLTLEDQIADKAFQRAMQLQELKNKGMENVAFINTQGKIGVQESANTGKVNVEAIKHESLIKHTALEHALEPEEEKVAAK